MGTIDLFAILLSCIYKKTAKIETQDVFQHFESFILENLLTCSDDYTDFGVF